VNPGSIRCDSVSGRRSPPLSTDLDDLAAFGQGIDLFAELRLKQRQERLILDIALAST
jgi:hypothetical protein